MGSDSELVGQLTLAEHDQEKVIATPGQLGFTILAMVLALLAKVLRVVVHREPSGRTSGRKLYGVARARLIA